ncbi:redox-sensing transcriptional repressor Rex [Alloiococcus sp. CFN-8]|uniref:redox-sensing transcriptional repressor Rex n=1 Tax=Alloiococcus sp. CFN-8 TaxID=3416081 RepID=UPI003CE810F9
MKEYCKSDIPASVIKRLPKYRRHLKNFLGEVDKISSSELSKCTGFSSSQIRQDLSRFGNFGHKGYGYDVQILYDEISDILGIRTKYSLIIIGAGNLGQALFYYYNDREDYMDVAGLFDVNPKIVGLKMKNKEVYDVDYLEEFLKQNSVDIAALCVPKKAAPELYKTLSTSDIKAIWNFTPIDLPETDKVNIRNVHFSDSLLTLVYRINNIE